jgi:hypothetical protein
MKKIYTFLIFALVPLLAHGANVTAPKNFKGLVALITSIIGKLILLVFALTFLAFLWGVVKGWVIHGGDTEGVETGKNVVMTSIIALVVMSSIWGILRLLQMSLF